MPSFGTKSRNNLNEAHPDLQHLFERVVENRDCSVVEGFRGEAEQNYAFKSGASKLKFPQSKHNQTPSQAVDVWPYPRPAWDDTPAWKDFATYVKGVADGMGIDIVSGGLEWGWDYPHFELRS